MALTKEQIFAAMQPKKKPVVPLAPKPKTDNFADLVSKLKDKKKE